MSGVAFKHRHPWQRRRLANPSYLSPRVSVYFSAELSTLAPVERCSVVWAEEKNFSLLLHPILRLAANGTERSDWLNEESLPDLKKERRGKNWKIFMMLMVSGAPWFRLNILGIHSSPPHRPQNDSGSDWDVKNAETFFYFSNLYPFSLKQANY